ncbi:MAG: SCO family protein [Chromatiales bacterium]|nr:SCO family protein [Chromatiales bacterium]
MIKNISKKVFSPYVVVFLTLLFLNVSYAKDLNIIATIKPIHSILAGLMEGIEQPHLLIDGAPFKFKPNSTQQKSLLNSDLIVWVGPELESSLQPFISSLPPKVKVIELLSNERLKILSKRYDDSLRDPYFWLDTRNALILLDELAYALIDLDPVRTHIYRRNRTKIREELRKFDHKLEYGYRGLQGGVSYLYHDTQQYFEQAYALKIGGQLLYSPYAQIDAAKFLKARMELANGDFDCLLTERGFPDSEVDLLAPKDGNRVWQLDSLGLQFSAGADLYINLMQHNSAVIKQCLNVNNGLEPVDTSLLNNNLEDRDDEDGRFFLINQFGELITEKDMLGKYQLIFFGYTSCPDICPLSLHTLISALDLLGNDAKKFKSYFITVDPERDDVKVMRRYVDYFGGRIVGLTGQPAMLKQVAKHYHVKYRKVYNNKNKDDYQMDHTAGLFVIAPDGQFITKLANGISAETMAKALTSIVN